ncbi:EAL domain-containing protein [Pseudomonas caspiana]|uniref:EAL domain-containing protein n=1 Tax=Pseudomonas caspiana TaxID=1451454 RepID=UPI0032EB965D
MRRSVVQNLALLGASSLLFMFIAFFSYLAIRNAKDKASFELKTAINEVIQRSAVTQAQVDGAFRAQSTAALIPCSPDHLALMQAELLKASYLKELAYIQGDSMLCSTLPGANAEIFLGPANHTTATGSRRWNRMVFPNAPNTTFVVTELDGYAAIISPELVIDVGGDHPEIAITRFRNSNRILAYSRGAFRQEWLTRYEGKSISFFDDEYFVFIQAGSDAYSSVLAAMPAARVNQMIRAAMPSYLAGGFLAGLVSACILFAFARCRLSFRSQLVRALKRREFFLVYQPVVDMRTGECIGAEALIRWNHPERGIISPDNFIPAAEADGLIRQVTAQVMELVAEDVGRLFTDIPKFHIAINLSVEDLHSEKTEEHLLNLIRVTRGSPENILIEVTERGLMDPVKAKKVVASIRESGFEIAIDDFGIGNSSLSYLSTYELDYLKIDKSFVDGIGNHRSNCPLWFHIIEIAKALGLKLIAEGVETEKQRDILLEAGVHMAQGWFFAKPLPINELRIFIDASRTQLQATPSSVSSR